MMSDQSHEKSSSTIHHKLVKANPPKHAGPCKKEIYVGNLPLDIKEEEIVSLFKTFGVKSVKKHHSSFKSFAFLEMVSPEAAQLAKQVLNGHLVRGRPMSIAFSENRKGQEPLKTTANAKMPGLEVIPFKDLGLHSNLVPKSGAPVSPVISQRLCYAVPMEMRSSFLLHMLNDCFKDTKWLISIAKVRGNTGLLVMDTFPQTPYFWAVHLTEEHHQNMKKLFTALAEAESQLPFLANQDVQRGSRCLAECVIGNEGSAWNRCWVWEKMEDVAAVFFMDFGRCATVPLTSLRKLNGDEFWKIGPLAQPFVLEGDVCPPQVMIRQILEGKVMEPLQGEMHILKFVLKAE